MNKEILVLLNKWVQSGKVFVRLINLIIGGILFLLKLNTLIRMFLII